MKTTIKLLSMLFTMATSLQAQIVFEQKYLDAGYYSTATGTAMPGGIYYCQKPLYMVNLEVSGNKYAKVDFQGQVLTLYNLNHTVFKTISFAGVTILSPSGAAFEKSLASILYISEHLFDTDNEIEFMYTVFPGGSNPCITQIVNENGSILFTATDEAPAVKLNVHNQFYPIYNTSSGTKMILSKRDSSAMVYSLGGTFTELLQNNSFFAEQGITLSPNPVQKQTQIQISYSLPENIQAADLIISDQQGREIKHLKLDINSKDILLPTHFLEPGLYYYSIYEDSRLLVSKKSLVVD